MPSCQEEADSRDFAEFIAGQDPLDVAAAAWIVRRQDGLTPDEEAELAEWLAADPSHAEALAQVEAVWGRMDAPPDTAIEALKLGLPQRETPISRVGVARAEAQPPDPAPGRGARNHPGAVPELGRRLQTAPSTGGGRRGWLLGLGRLVPRAAATAVAVGAVGGAWFGWRQWQAHATFSGAFASVRGEQKEVRLPDGSTVWLDTATRIEVDLFRQRREVRLIEGQAMFAVRADPAQPFEVVAADIRVTVVGTRFSVRRTRSGLGPDGSVSVAVEEGQVRVAGRQAGIGAQDAGVDPISMVELGAGQSITADATGTLGRVGAETAAAWREGRVSFNGIPLAQALAEFERYGDTGLIIRDPVVGALKVQGSFDLRQVGAFARALPQVLPVRLRPGDGQMEIVAAGRR